MQHLREKQRLLQLMGESPHKPNTEFQKMIEHMIFQVEHAQSYIIAFC